jgi:hypothetical protein
MQATTMGSDPQSRTPARGFSLVLGRYERNPNMLIVSGTSVVSLRGIRPGGGFPNDNMANHIVWMIYSPRNLLLSIDIDS